MYRRLGFLTEPVTNSLILFRKGWNHRCCFGLNNSWTKFPPAFFSVDTDCFGSNTDVDMRRCLEWGVTALQLNEHKHDVWMMKHSNKRHGSPRRLKMPIAALCRSLFSRCPDLTFTPRILIRNFFGRVQKHQQTGCSLTSRDFWCRRQKIWISRHGANITHSFQWKSHQRTKGRSRMLKTFLKLWSVITSLSDCSWNPLLGGCPSTSWQHSSHSWRNSFGLGDRAAAGLAFWILRTPSTVDACSSCCPNARKFCGRSSSQHSHLLMQTLFQLLHDSLELILLTVYCA